MTCEKHSHTFSDRFEIRNVYCVLFKGINTFSDSVRRVVKFDFCEDIRIFVLFKKNYFSKLQTLR